MKFQVLEPGEHPTQGVTNTFYLYMTNWNDWFEFKTLYSLAIVDGDGKYKSIGSVKIGQIDMNQDQSRPDLPNSFDALTDKFFSLGQDDSYYERLNGLGSDVRDAALIGLRDIAKDAAIYDIALAQKVTRVSLLRSVTPVAVKGQFRRLSQGGARLSRYNFVYNAPKSGAGEDKQVNLGFEVTPDSYPPSNIHVIIGRNGVGKTRLLNNMINALLKRSTPSGDPGSFISEELSKNGDLFANLISVTFSAFDPFEPLDEKRDNTEGIKYSYVGLKRSDDRERGIPKSPDLLEMEFSKSVKFCIQGARLERWKRAIETLEADPIFQAAEVATLARHGASFVEAAALDADAKAEANFDLEARALFNQFSSGHKLILLTITRLVEKVEERTLVLLDEPEAHLHPPLLSAFVRSLSDLLIDRNGVAIIATHSPVVLQEVPKNCVWALRRTGTIVSTERLESETFGENIGILTREVFGLEVSHSGFHKLLKDAVEKGGDYEEVLGLFNDKLGGEAKAIVRGLIAARAVKST